MAFILHKRRHAVTTEKYRALAAPVGRHIPLTWCSVPAALGARGAHKTASPVAMAAASERNLKIRNRAGPQLPRRHTVTVKLKRKSLIPAPRQQTAVPRDLARSASLGNCWRITIRRHPLASLRGASYRPGPLRHGPHRPPIYPRWPRNLAFNSACELHITVSSVQAFAAILQNGFQFLLGNLYDAVWRNGNLSSCDQIPVRRSLGDIHPRHCPSVCSGKLTI
jgi:hypothetical protein